MKNSPEKLADQYPLRMPHNLRARVQAQAAANKRSLNKEILSILSEAVPEISPPQPLVDISELVATLRAATSSDDFAARRDRANRQLAKAGLALRFSRDSTSTHIAFDPPR